MAVDQLLGPSPRPDEFDQRAGAPGPQAFVVRFPPGSPTLRVHYHPVPQFQYFGRDGGRYAGHPVARGLAHYADAHQPYGPIEPGADGMDLLTLRTTPDCGAWFMPESREDLRGALGSTRPAPAERLNKTFDLLRGDAAAGWTTLLERDDGLAVRLSLATSDRPLPSLQVGGSGAYLVVVDGSLEGAPAAGAAWVPPGDEVGVLPATGPGARVALMQLPASGQESGPS